ncbi:MAG: CopD family protein [Parvularculaceae bacterium]
MQELLITLYPWIKSFHLVLVVAWMAGMMYLPRLFIYHLQSTIGGEAEKIFLVMERRLLKGIINPSMIGVWLLGILLLIARPDYAMSAWFLIKFAGVVGISAIHGLYAGAYKKFLAGERPKSIKYWRICNEVPFVLMILIIIMVIVKPF